MRCLYCRPPDAVSADRERLSADEIESVVRHLARRYGLRKVRLTGGEPTARKDHVDVLRRIKAISGIGEVALTTNGLTLARGAEEYKAAGLDRVNVSLDSLDPRRFAGITGIDGLSRVLGGIRAVQAAGLTPVKTNTVVLRQENDDELPSIVRWAAAMEVEARFIELMPMGPLAAEWQDRFVSESEMRQRLAKEVTSWVRLPRSSASAVRYKVGLRSGASAVIGFITPMSCNFCARCDRIRLSSDGTLYPCLMDRAAGDIRSAVRPRFQPELLDRILAEAYRGKAAEHPRTGAGIMTHIGG
jgi:cyclic pyranopterin phosphate synthase